MKTVRATFKPDSKESYLGHLSCKCGKDIHSYKGNNYLLCPQCHRRWNLKDTNGVRDIYTFVGYRCPTCGTVAPTLFKLSTPYTICSKCMLESLDKLIQHKMNCEISIQEINKLRTINNL